MASSRSYRNDTNTDSEITKPLSLVQQRARQFEALASIQVKSKECNWWLSDFKNVKDNSCECDPCENSKVIDEGDIDSEKFVDVHVDDVQENVDDVQVGEEEAEDEHNEFSEEYIPVDAKEISEDENISTKDNEFMLVDSHVEGTVIEAMNKNVNFEGPSNTHSIKLKHSNDEETHATDE